MSKFRNFAVAVITLIGVTNTFGSFYLSQRSIKSNAEVSDESLENSNNQEGTSLSLENTTEGANTLNANTSSANIITTTTIVTESVVASETTLAQTTTQKPVPTKKYEIIPISKLMDGQMCSTQSFVVDLDDNIVYYLDRQATHYDIAGWADDYVYYIMKYNISNGSTGTLKKFERHEEGLSPIALTYNPYDQNVYCFSGSSKTASIGLGVYGTFALFNVETDEYITLDHPIIGDGYYYSSEFRSFYFTSANEFVIERNYLEGNRPFIYQYSLSTSSNIKGFIETTGFCEMGVDIPFLHNENYYWLCSRAPQFTIVETDRLIYPSESTNYGKILVQYSSDDNWCASNVYNNEVYLMNNEFSVYKVNLDNMALELYLDGNEIKQTGISYLSSIKCFSFVSDDSILVYDDFDKNYKLISAIK